MCFKTFWCTPPSGSYIMHPYSLLNVATFFIFRGLTYINKSERRTEYYLGELWGRLQLGSSATLISEVIPETSCPISILQCITSYPFNSILYMKATVSLFMAAWPIWSDETTFRITGFVDAKNRITLLFDDPSNLHKMRDYLYFKVSRTQSLVNREKNEFASLENTMTPNYHQPTEQGRC